MYLSFIILTWSISKEFPFHRNDHYVILDETEIVADDWDECRIRFSGKEQDTLCLTDNAMYVIGLFGLYDYDGHNAYLQCHNVYFS